MRKPIIAAIVTLGAAGLDQACKGHALSARATIAHFSAVPLTVTLIAGLACSGMLWLLSLTRTELLWPSAALTAGFLGNLVDRIAPGRGGVLDHWSLDLVSVTLVLNLADVLLLTGLVGLVVASVRPAAFIRSSKRSA